MYNIVITKSTVRHFAFSTLSCSLEPSFGNCWNTMTILMSPTDHFPYVNSKVVYQPVGYVAPCKGIRIPESRNFLLVESGILGFGIRNPAQGIRNPTKGWNPESNLLKIHCRSD